jgi:hypothetical protein
MTLNQVERKPGTRSSSSHPNRLSLEHFVLQPKHLTLLTNQIEHQCGKVENGLHPATRVAHRRANLD